MLIYSHLRIMSSLTYNCAPKIQQKLTHPRNRNRLTDIENRLVVAKEEKGRKGNRLGVLRLAEANYYI